MLEKKIPCPVEIHGVIDFFVKIGKLLQAAVRKKTKGEFR
jgi:hypothetical protein